MSINVDAACAAPTHTGDYTQIWTGEMTVGSFTSGSDTFYGYNGATDPDTGALDPTTIEIDSTDYSASIIFVQSTGSNAGRLVWNFTTTPDHPSTAQAASLIVYACDTGFPLRSFTARGDGAWTLADSGLDWSAVTERTLYISRDTTIPTLPSAVIDGDSLALTYNEDLYEDGSTGPSAFDITIGTASAVNPSNVSTAGKKVTLTLATAVTATDTVTPGVHQARFRPHRESKTSPATRQRRSPAGP